MRNVLFLAWFAAALTAADKQAPPAPGKPKAFTLPQHETYSLPNGMRVTLVPWGSLPVASVRASLDFGNINETKDQVWLTDFMAALMKEGAAGKSGAQLDRQAPTPGGSLNFNARDEMSSASMNCVGEFAPQAVSLLSDLLRKPDFPASEVERLRGDSSAALSWSVPNRRHSPANSSLKRSTATILSGAPTRSEEHTSELQSPCNLVC